jgi:putative ABC transport system ATP-binding protein
MRLEMHDGCVEKLGAQVHVAGLRHTYRTPLGSLEVLREVRLQIPAGGYFALQGPSGAGKTTLLAILGGLTRPQSGSVRVDHAELSSLDSEQLASYRRDTVGFVFQHFGLLEALTALENVELASALAGASRQDRRRRAEELLSAVGLLNRARHRPTQLSGGERQRVAIARALANQPRLLLADEPTGNLDEHSAREVVDLLEALRHSWGFTMLVVTHNWAVARRAPNHLRLSNGGLAA